MHPSALQRVKDITGADFSACFQCKKCSVGCPAQEYMEFKPNQVIRLLQYGRLDEVLKSSTMWYCLSCQTCYARCPNSVDYAGVMDALRNIAIQDNIKPAVPEVAAFHKQFLKTIRRNGRLHEVGFIIRFKLATFSFFKDAGLGMKMFFKGKLPLFGRKVKKRDEIKKIFEDN